MGNRALLSLAAGFGGGYMAGAERRKDRERQAKIDAQNTELHDARMEEINAGRAQRVALADAAAPRTAQSGTVVDGGQGQEFYADPAQAGAVQQDRQAEAEMRAEQAGQTAPSLAQARPGYGVSAGSRGQIRTDKPDMDAENSPDAKLKRQIDVIQKSDPAKAITLANAAIEHKQRLQKEADDAAFRKINGFQTPQEMADFMTEYPNDGMGGKFKAKALPSADGKTWSFVGTDKDGKEVKIPGDYTNDADGMMKARMALAGRFGDPNRRMEFYKWDQEMGRKKDVAAEAGRHNAVMEKAANTQAEAALERAKAARGAAGNPSREERIRYTTLFNDAGRRLAESRKTLTTLQKSPLFAINAKKPGTPEAQQLQELNDNISAYEEERSTYQSLLAGSQEPAGKKPGAPTAAAPAQDGGIAQPASQADYDALPKGTKYMRDGRQYIKN